MTTSEERLIVLHRIWEAWNRMPELSFGQVIESSFCPDLFADYTNRTKISQFNDAEIIEMIRYNAYEYDEEKRSADKQYFEAKQDLVSDGMGV